MWIYRAHERTLADAAAAIEREAHRGSLSALDEDRRPIRIDGVPHALVLRGVVAEYKTRVGPVAVPRSLFAGKVAGETTRGTSRELRVSRDVITRFAST